MRAHRHGQYLWRAAPTQACVRGPERYLDEQAPVPELLTCYGSREQK